MWFAWLTRFLWGIHVWKGHVWPLWFNRLGHRCGVWFHGSPKGYAAVPYAVCTVLCFKDEQVVSGKANVCCLNHRLEEAKGDVGHAVYCFEWIGGAAFLNLNAVTVCSEVEFIAAFAAGELHFILTFRFPGWFEGFTFHQFKGGAQWKINLTIISHGWVF